MKINDFRPGVGGETFNGLVEVQAVFIGCGLKMYTNVGMFNPIFNKMPFCIQGAYLNTLGKLVMSTGETKRFDQVSMRALNSMADSGRDEIHNTRMCLDNDPASSKIAIKGLRELVAYPERAKQLFDEVTDDHIEVAAFIVATVDGVGIPEAYGPDGNKFLPPQAAESIPRQT